MFHRLTGRWDVLVNCWSDGQLTVDLLYSAAGSSVETLNLLASGRLFPHPAVREQQDPLRGILLMNEVHYNVYLEHGD